MQAMKDWYKEHPHLFHKRPYDRPGCNIYDISALTARCATTVKIC